MDMFSHPYRKDLALGFLFICISVFSCNRIFYYYDPNGGKVVTILNVLIFLTSILRSIWFFVPESVYEITFTFQPLQAFVSQGWEVFLLTEVLNLAGTVSLYSIFILISVYWAHMLRKVTVTSTYSRENSGTHRPRSMGTLELFFLLVAIFSVISLAGSFLFVAGKFDSEELILCDSVVLTLASIAILTALTLLSFRIRRIMTSMGALTDHRTFPQIRRILAVTIAANMFFMCRVGLECTLAAALTVLIQSKFILVSASSYCFSLK